MYDNRDCWWCNNYEMVLYGARCVNRLVYRDAYTYVIVPLESHVRHHLLVVLREHRDTLIDCDEKHLRHIGATVAKTCKVLRSTGYDRVYAGCYSDDRHVHYHLIPFIKAADKPYDGYAMHRLAVKERLSAAHPFCGMTDLEKLARLDEIGIVVADIRGAWPTGG